jgi:hypothetical protein
MWIETLVQRDPWAATLLLIVMALVPPATALIGSRLGLPGAVGTGRHVRQAKPDEDKEDTRL